MVSGETIGERQKTPVILYAPILRYPQKDDAVDGALHGEVQLVDRNSGVAKRNVAS